MSPPTQLLGKGKMVDLHRTIVDHYISREKTDTAKSFNPSYGEYQDKDVCAVWSTVLSLGSETQTVPAFATYAWGFVVDRSMKSSSCRIK
jgi:hypothetical protein